MSKNAIIFGATGLIGNHLLFELLENEDFTSIKTITRKPLPLSHPKLQQIIVEDFEKLPDFADVIKADVIFCCIGTTIKKAGSQDAFRKVDLNIPVTVAKIAQNNNIENLIIISSIGANAGLSNFYLKTKGQMEQQVTNIFSGNLKFLRPSLLLGSRKEFRLGEEIGKVFTAMISLLMFGPLRKYRGIHALAVARGMIKAIDMPREQRFVESDEIAKMVGHISTHKKTGI
ncbi:MAG: NAD(P)H-binding protein [Bacteroidota bacterium]|nr:NAD(P)H-binding protein [Bacteroidota bacterium]